jgi:hypothetical protein
MQFGDEGSLLTHRFSSKHTDLMWMCEQTEVRKFAFVIVETEKQELAIPPSIYSRTYTV